MNRQNGANWGRTTLGELLRESEVRVRDLPSNESSNLEVLSLTKNRGLIPQAERFNKRIATEDISKYKVVRPGWIVYNPYVIWEGAVHALRRSEPGVVSPVYPIFERTEDDGGFLDFVLRTDALIDAYNQLSSGAVNRRRSIKKDDFLGIEIVLPPLPEQRAIAQVLRTVQWAKEATEKVIAAARQLKQSLMGHLFTYGPVPFQEAEKVELKETEVGPMPEHWQLDRLGGVTLIERGKFAHRPRNDPRFYGGPIPFIQTGDVAKSGGRITTYTQTLNELGLSVSRVFPKGTIVLTIAANIGDTAILGFDSAFPDSLVGITPKTKIIRADFLLQFLQTQKAEMDRLAPRGTQKNINIRFLEPWPLTLPPLSEQHEIAVQLTASDAKLAAEETRRNALEALFQSLLHHLMTGKMRVPLNSTAV